MWQCDICKQEISYELVKIITHLRDDKDLVFCKTCYDDCIVDDEPLYENK